jgi:hypothetical protein
MFVHLKFYDKFFDIGADNLRDFLFSRYVLP